ncbi:MAG: endonuclease, partial [Candidatus Marinimicrobia bacterium]|nr:endonuclease [Candidatus Neomarinimicrobiota bacterium]
MNNLTKLRFTAATIILLFILSGTLPADIPAGYYDAAKGKAGAELKAALNTIVNTGLHQVSYGDARFILNETDQDPENPANIILVYRGASVSGDWDSGTTWNREHVWPQSLLGVDVNNNSINVGSDLHNLKPANPSENSSRGNKYYDNQTTTISYAPRDEVKGDLARILFYMVIMYEVAPLDLELVNHTPNLYEMALLNVLLEWHELDPVDDFERNRNEIIYSYQHNRNPFIDSSGFVDRIWIDTTGQSGNSTLFSSEYIDDYRLYPCYPNPFNPTTTIQYELYKE